MDNLDKKVLALIQEDFPLTHRPYAAIAERAGCTEEEAFRRVMRMKEAGLIRRIGGNFDSHKLGCVTTLVAMRVPEQEAESVAAIVSSYPEVTHNYQREGQFNLWFTVVAESANEMERILHEIGTRVPGAEVLNLPAKKVFKLNVRFEPVAE